MKICTLVKSCKSNLNLSSNILANHPADIFIYYGDHSIEDDCIDGFNIVLKCDDSWGGLLEKHTKLLNFANKNSVLLNYTHFFIIDSREAFHHASELYKTLRSLEHKAIAFNNKRLKKIDDIHKDNHTSFKKKFSLDDFDYASDFIHNPNSTNNSFRTSYYHIEKASGEEKPLNGPELQFTPGSGTLFSSKSFKILDEFLSDCSNKSELFSVFRNFADDVVSAFILKKNHIYPKTYPFNIYMRNYDIYFPELATKFEYINENNDLQLFKFYQKKFKKINILSNKPNNFNDLANSYSMKRFLDELEVGLDSIDSIFINLLIYINKNDVEGYQYTVKNIIQNNLFKNKFCKEILICLSMAVSKKTQIGFYQPMIDLLDKYFKVFNFKYLLKAKISIINSDFVNLYRIVDQLHKKNYVDAQNIKNNIIIHLINNDFKPILLKYLHCKYDNFITKITIIHYQIKLEKYDDALNLLNTLECSSDSELHRKNIISFKLAKSWGNFELCRDIMGSLNLDNKKNVDLNTKILSFLS